MTLLLMTQMKKNYTGHEMSSKNTTNLSEHIIFIASTHV
jgi:hypothetical protein